MKTNKTLKTVALASLMGSALLLTGCGGGGGAPTAAPSYTPPAGYTPPAEMGSVGSKTTTLSYDIPIFGTVNVDVTDLIDAERLIDSIQLGRKTPTEIWNNMPYDVQQTVARLASEESGTIITVEEISNDPDLLDANVNVDIWQEVADEINSTFTPTQNITDIEARKAFDQIDEVGATEAWSLGWTGEGVHITSIDSSFRTAEALITARAIAPGSVTTDIREGDIHITSMNNVSLQRLGSPDYVKTNTEAEPWSTGQFAGVSALVMQKFPTAANASVGSAVNNSETNGNYNALRALSPSM